MRFAFNTPNMGIYGDARKMVALAREAEEAGWDGFFLWDHIGSGRDWPAAFADPWILLTGMAMATKRIKLGPIVTPLPRRRPWKVAREAVTLDHLSEGRLILGVGIGSDLAREFSCYGESGNDRLHGEMLDEELDIITGLWSGKEFSYEGRHYQIKNACFQPTPLQQPRIPIWVAGCWPNKKPFRRAARFDGICPIVESRLPSPQDYREIRDYMQTHLTPGQTFDVLASGYTTGTDRQRDRDILSPFAEAGVTWWQECTTEEHTFEQVRARVRLGPPHL